MTAKKFFRTAISLLLGIGALDRTSMLAGKASSIPSNDQRLRGHSTRSNLGLTGNQKGKEKFDFVELDFRPGYAWFRSRQTGEETCLRIADPEGNAERRQFTRAERLRYGLPCQ